MKLIESKTLGTAQASIEFTSIPQDGTDLVALCSTRSSAASIVGGIRALPNGGTGQTRRLVGSGGAGVVYSDVVDGIFGLTSAANNTANTFGNAVFYFPNYTSTVNKPISVDSVSESNASEVYSQLSASSYGTAAITSITFNDAGTNLEAGSTISLYKITKGSDGIVTTS
jgi:hypothetical protein